MSGPGLGVWHPRALSSLQRPQEAGVPIKVIALAVPAYKLPHLSGLMQKAPNVFFLTLVQYPGGWAALCVAFHPPEHMAPESPQWRKGGLDTSIECAEELSLEVVAITSTHIPLTKTQVHGPTEPQRRLGNVEDHADVWSLALSSCQRCSCFMSKEMEVQNLSKLL